MSQLLLATLLGGSVCFAAFSWGVRGHFRSTGAMPRGMQVTSLLSLVLFLMFVLRLCIGRLGGLALIAVVLFAAALSVFGWSIRATRRTPPTLAFDTDQPLFLLRHGPYRYVRHPFYLAYMLFWLGTAVATQGWAGWLAPVAMLTLYAHAARKEEQKFASSALAADYASYRGRAGMFLPRPWALLAR